MAHTVTGIDLGAHAVKLVLVELGFRQSRVLSSFAIPVPPGEAPLLERQGEALRAGMTRLDGDAFTIFMALPGEKVAVRVLDLPFSDPRKIEQVVGYELESQIVHSLQEVVFDHAVLEAPPGAAEADPSSVPAGGSSVLTVAAKTDEVGAFLDAMKSFGCEPRSLFAAPVIYQALAGDATEASGLCRVLLDFGHSRTNVCFLVGGKTVFARTITRGGAVLTAAVGRVLGCTDEEAEQAKHDHGFVSSTRAVAEGAVASRLDGALREALVPLVRELRQTLTSFRAKLKFPIESLSLTGGGAALGGLGDFLEDELELPVVPWRPNGVIEGPDDDVTQVRGLGHGGAFSLAEAIAWAGARGGKQIDLRRGPYLYRASFSVVRQKAAHLAALAGALLVCATIDGTMALARLDKQKEQLTAQLKSATQELFGAPRMDAKGVAIELKKSFRDDMAPLPKATAFDLLDQISRHMPSPERIKLDLLELDIRPKKASLQGTVDSAAAVDEIVSALNEVDCFEQITKGAITESGGAKKFTLTIASKCP